MKERKCCMYVCIYQEYCATCECNTSNTLLPQSTVVKIWTTNRTVVVASSCFIPNSWSDDWQPTMSSIFLLHFISVCSAYSRSRRMNWRWLDDDSVMFFLYKRPFHFLYINSTVKCSCPDLLLHLPTWFFKSLLSNCRGLKINYSRSFSPRWSFQTNILVLVS